MDQGFMKLSDIINTKPEFEGLSKRIKETEVLDGFIEIFPDLGKVAKAMKVDKKTLFLKVENSVWRSELKFSESAIVEKINKFFKEERIKFIKFL
jgi:replicative superfamily II helicase